MLLIAEIFIGVASVLLVGWIIDNFGRSIDAILFKITNSVDEFFERLASVFRSALNTSRLRYLVASTLKFFLL